MIIQNEELKAWLLEAGKKVVLVRGISKQIDELDEARNKEAIAHQKLKEKINPIMKQYIADLKEYEDIVEVKVINDKNGEPTNDIEIIVVDRLEDWKKQWAEKKAELAKEEADKLAASEVKTEPAK